MQDFQEQIRFKRILRIPVDAGKHLAVSLASNNTYTVTQFMVGLTGAGEPLSVPVPGALRLSRKPSGIIKLLRALAWIAARLEDSEISPEDRNFINLIRDVEEQEIRLEKEMVEIGYPPTNFTGQSYNEFQQAEDNQRRRLY